MKPKKSQMTDVVNWGVWPKRVIRPGTLSRIREYGFIRYNSYFSRKGVERDDGLLLVTNKGRGKIKHHGKEFPVRRGTVSLYLQGEDQYYGGEGWEAYWFHIYLSKSLLKLLAAAGITSGRTFSCKLTEDELERMAEVFTYHQMKESLAMHRCAVLVERIILICIDQPSPDFSVLSPMRVQDVVDYLERNPVGPCDVETLARMVNLSPSRFAHLFQEEYGQSVHKFISSLRIGRARRLLETTAMTVSEIAYEVGYNTPHHFYAMFKAIMGMTPLQYRDSRR